MTNDESTNLRRRIDELAAPSAPDVLRLAVRMALSLYQPHGVPIGGVVSEFVGEFWRSSFERKVPDVLEAFAAAIEQSAIDKDALLSRLVNGELAQAFFADVLATAWRTTTESERKRLGILLAKGLDADDRSLADLTYLLQRWREMDKVQMLLFTEIGNARTSKRKPVIDPTMLGSSYFQGEDHPERMYKDDIHRHRMDQLMAMGLILPVDAEGWRARKYGYQIENFHLSPSGRELYSILTEG